MPYSVGASFKLDLPAAKAYSGRLARALMDGAGLIIEADWKRMLSHPGTGNEYPRQGGRKVHVASAPGEPPAVDTGRLRASITHGVVDNGAAVHIGSETAKLEMKGGGMVNYLTYLEFGTSRMAPRPSARPVCAQYIGNDKLVQRTRAHLRKMGFGV